MHICTNSSNCTLKCTSYSIEVKIKATTQKQINTAECPRESFLKKGKDGCCQPCLPTTLSSGGSGWQRVGWRAPASHLEAWLIMDPLIDNDADKVI